MDMKRHPFNWSFILGNMQKSQGARSGEQAGWGTVVTLFFVMNSLAMSEVCEGTLSWCNNQSPFFHISGVCASHFPSVISKPCSKNFY
jgi:hypothetical protein